MNTTYLMSAIGQKRTVNKYYFGGRARSAGRGWCIKIDHEINRY